MFKRECGASSPCSSSNVSPAKQPEMDRMLQRKAVSLLIRVLLFLSLPRASCSDAATDHEILHSRQSIYADHDVVLNASRHDEEFFTFLSRPDIAFAPRWDIESHNTSSLSPGYWLIAPYAGFVGHIQGPAWTATYIYEGKGELIWFGGHMMEGWTISDFRVSNVTGKLMLTMIHHHWEKAYLVDETYNIHREIDLSQGEGAHVNGHELVFVDGGTRALYFTNRIANATREESEKIGFAGNCNVLIQGFEELETTAWEPLFSWTEEDHISLDESYAVDEAIDDLCGVDDGSWDYAHLNAMHKFPDGDYFVSSRRTFALYKISHKDGSIVWRLGGKRSDFKLDTAWTGQHGARVHSQNETHIVVSFLDNARFSHKIPPTHENSRALFLTLHVAENPMRAETLLSIDQPDGGYNAARGNVQVLPNGNIWACWVKECLFSEHHADGSMLMKAKLKPELSTYRSYKSDWIGRPSLPPDVYAAATEEDWKVGLVVHVSWNGATEVKRWRLWRSDASGRLLDIMAHTQWQGFESVMHADEFAQYVVVEAMDGDGTTLGKSNVVRPIVPHEITDIAMAAEQKGQQEHAISSKVYSMLQDSVVQAICGAAFALGILAAVAWIALRQVTLRSSVRIPWWRSKDVDYTPVPVTDADGEGFTGAEKKVEGEFVP